MSETQPLVHYEITVEGTLDPRWSAWFDGLQLASDAAGRTTITGPVADQAALHGLLTKVRDLGLPLLTVRRRTTVTTAAVRDDQPGTRPHGAAATVPGMPTDNVIEQSRPVTRSQLERDLASLGVRAGAIMMVHTRMRALGWVVGGAQTVVEALLAALGSEGTLMAYAGWEDDPYHLAEWPREWQQAYRAELPPFDPALSEADHQMGRLPERIRTWPGATASAGHVMRMVAVGAQAEWLTAGQPWHHPAGPGSPLAKLVEADGQVLMLGAPLDTLTLLHHAEALVDSPGKRMVTYAVPVRDGGQIVWREVHDHDTSSRGAFPYERAVPDGEDAFAVIGRQALAAGAGTSGTVGDAESHLFGARSVVDFATGWLRRNFGGI